ncbi:MAG: Nif3-like dinuclear metal center hexameric protein [Candidatus Krumholzibacteriota bacterium]|nr:Nif3-like dinuclear metal center hexameric protein [Candidatus Krumholzibacteriota bacterium]
MKLRKIVEFIDQTLNLSAFPGDSSLNGLQVEGRSSVSSVALAVDACQRAIQRSVGSGADLLIVHHGLFWGGNQPITGIMAKRLGALLQNGISLYAAHLPLDCHPEIGNNAQLARLLHLDGTEPFGDYHGIRIGLAGNLPRPLKVRSFSARLRKLLNAPSRNFEFGRSEIRKLGIVSGGGASLVKSAAEEGLDALLTGETAHSAYHIAREYRINLFCAGHYATETLGVKALGSLLRERFGLQTRFLDIPTGL